MLFFSLSGSLLAIKINNNRDFIQYKIDKSAIKEEIKE